MAIQMISDLPVLQVTKDTSKDNLMGSYMEISYLSSDANSGDKQTRYKSMAIPLGALYQALMASSSGSGGLYDFQEKCQFLKGLDLSGDIKVNMDENNLHKLALKMTEICLSAPSTELSSNNQTIHVKSLFMIDTADGSNSLVFNNSKFNFKKEVNFEKKVTSKTITDPSYEDVVNYQMLQNAIEKTSGTNGIMFETRLLDYKDDNLSASGWVRMNADTWLLSSDFSSTYNHLTSDFESATTYTDQYSSQQVTYNRAIDGHKIISCDNTNITNVDNTRNNIYNETGCFWYYLLDKQNKRFKLPMTSVFMQSIGKSNTQNTGNYVKPALPIPPAHNHSYSTPTVKSNNVKIESVQNNIPWIGNDEEKTTGYSSDSNWKTDSIYSSNTNTVQPPAIGMETYMRCM